MFGNYRRLRLRLKVFYSHFKLGIVRFFLCEFYFEKESFFLKSLQGNSFVFFSVHVLKNLAAINHDKEF